MTQTHQISNNTNLTKIWGLCRGWIQRSHQPQCDLISWGLMALDSRLPIKAKIRCVRTKSREFHCSALRCFCTVLYEHYSTVSSTKPVRTGTVMFCADAVCVFTTGSIRVVPSRTVRYVRYRRDESARSKIQLQLNENCTYVPGTCPIHNNSVRYGTALPQATSSSYGVGS